MGLKIKNENNYELSSNIKDFFEISIPEVKENEYELLKKKIYALGIDNEEKANILNKINSLSLIKSSKETKSIIEEIKTFKQKYNL